MDENEQFHKNINTSKNTQNDNRKNKESNTVKINIQSNFREDKLLNDQNETHTRDFSFNNSICIKTELPNIIHNRNNRYQDNQNSMKVTSNHLSLSKANINDNSQTKNVKRNQSKLKEILKGIEKNYLNLESSDCDTMTQK